MGGVRSKISDKHFLKSVEKSFETRWKENIDEIKKIKTGELAAKDSDAFIDAMVNKTTYDYSQLYPSDTFDTDTLNTIINNNASKIIQSGNTVEDFRRDFIDYLTKMKDVYNNYVVIPKLVELVTDIENYQLTQYIEILKYQKNKCKSTKCTGQYEKYIRALGYYIPGFVGSIDEDDYIVAHLAYLAKQHALDLLKSSTDENIVKVKNSIEKQIAKQEAFDKLKFNSRDPSKVMNKHQELMNELYLKYTPKEPTQVKGGGICDSDILTAVLILLIIIVCFLIITSIVYKSNQRMVLYNPYPKYRRY